MSLMQPDGDFYSSIIQLLHLIPQDVFSISIEGNSGLLNVLKDPTQSSWMEGFKAIKVKRLLVFFKNFKISSSMRTLIVCSGFLGC